MALATENSIQLDNSNCRICLFAKQNLCPLFRRGLSMKVMKLADIKMYEGDGLPSSICLDCEFEVKRCTNFVAQIQQADAKLREMLAEKEKEVNETCVNDKEIVEGLAEGEEQEASTSQIEIEEFNVKQEITSLDNFIDEKEDFHSDSDHDHFGGGLDNIDQPEDDDELNPLNHVDVVEDINRGDQMDIFTDPLGQEEPLIESHTTEIDPSTDPLTYMKQEAVAMDVDKNMPEVPGPSSSVKGTMASMSFTIWPQIRNSNETRYDQNTLQHPQQLRLLLLKQNVISNTDSQKRNITATYISTDCTSSSSSVVSSSLATDAKVSKFKKVLPKRNEEYVQNIMDRIKKSKEISNEKQLKDLIEKYKAKWRKNESFCIICYVNCGNADLLLEHKENSVFICRICLSEFKHHTDLETHFFNHKPIKCELCQEICFSRQELLFHKKNKHQSIRFKCEVCNKSFARSRTLRAHKNVEHSGVGDHHKCVVCEKSYKLPSQLHSHMVKAHCAFEYQECKYCKALYIGPGRLKAHVKAKHLDCIDNALLGCKTCGKVFRGIHNLRQHEKTHDTTECLCELCGKSVRGKKAMNTHMNLKHSKNKSYICKYCNDHFKIRIDLQRHYKKCPRKLPKILTPLFCEICGKQYKSSAILNIHKRIHCDERPYKCEECGASFRQQVTLKTHSRVHNSVGKYCCADCGMTFKWKQTYDKHVNKCEAINHQVKKEIS